MNPYDSLPKRKSRVAIWWILVVALIAVIRVVALVHTSEQDASDDDIAPWLVWVIALVFVALLVGVILGSLALSARRRRRRLEEVAPGATVFFSSRGPELQQRLTDLGFPEVRLSERMAVTVDQWGVSLWGRNVKNGPLLMMKREYLAGVTAAMGETAARNGVRTFTGPALGVIARIGATQPGQAPGELLVPIPIYGPRGLSFAKKDLAWEVLQSAARFLPLRQPEVPAAPQAPAPGMPAVGS